MGRQQARQKVKNNHDVDLSRIPKKALVAWVKWFIIQNWLLGASLGGVDREQADEFSKHLKETDRKSKRNLLDDIEYYKRRSKQLFDEGLVDLDFVNDGLHSPQENSPVEAWQYWLRPLEELIRATGPRGKYPIREEFIPNFMLRQFMRPKSNYEDEFGHIPAGALIRLDFWKKWNPLETNTKKQFKVEYVEFYFQMVYHYENCVSLAPQDRNRAVREARATVLFVFSFLEAFLNSLACDYFTKNVLEGLTSKQENILLDEKHLSLANKINDYQKVILGLEHAPISPSNSEALKLILDSAKDHRNPLVHSSPQITKEGADWLRTGNYHKNTDRPPPVHGPYDLRVKPLVNVDMAIDPIFLSKLVDATVKVVYELTDNMPSEYRWARDYIFPRNPKDGLFTTTSDFQNSPYPSL